MLLNWAAPGAYRTKVQKWQREVLGEAMALVPGAIGVLLSPVYYHKKGSLWACEQAHLQMLSSESINTDRMGALLFKGKRDERDSRPRRETLSAVASLAVALAAGEGVRYVLPPLRWNLRSVCVRCVREPPGVCTGCVGRRPARACARSGLCGVVNHVYIAHCSVVHPVRQPMYPLRILVPAEEEKAKKTLNLWKAAPLLKTALTEPAEMLASKDMVAMEDLTEDALPSTTTASLNQSPTERHSQIGPDAASKLLTSVLHGAPEVAAFVVLDLSPRTGDFGLAVLSTLQDALVPTHYVAFPEDDEHKEWLDWWLKHNTTENILNGSLTPAGTHLPPEEPPADELVSLPPRPTLAALIWADRQSASAAVRLPDDVVAKWRSSSEFAPRVQLLIDSASAVGADPVVSPPPRQRPRLGMGGADGSTGAGSSCDADPGTAAGPAAIPVSEVPPLAHDIKFVSVREKALALCVAAPAVEGAGLFIANRGDSDVELPAGTLVAGFCSGKWVHGDQANPLNPAKDVSFLLESGETRVVVGGTVMTLEEALERAPSRKIQYHLLEPDPQPGAPGHFKLSAKNHVVYRCQDLPAVKKELNPESGEPALGLQQGHAASAVSPKDWVTGLTEIVWAVRYHAAKGLAPVRPQVLLKAALNLKAQTAVKL